MIPDLFFEDYNWSPKNEFGVTRIPDVGRERRNMGNKKLLDRVNVRGESIHRDDKYERAQRPKDTEDDYRPGTRRRKLARVTGEQDLAEAEKLISTNGHDKAEVEHHDQEIDLWYEDGVGRDAIVRTLDEPFRCAKLTPAEHRWLEDRVSIPYCVGPRPEPKPRPSPGRIPYVVGR